jgi:hypothetical protein
MSFEEIYEQCLTAHAHNWLENYRTVSHVKYLEFHGGPIITKAIDQYGVQTVVHDFIKKTISEK